MRVKVASPALALISILWVGCAAGPRSLEPQVQVRAPPASTSAEESRAAGAARAICGSQPVMRPRGGCCSPGDLMCAMEAGRSVPMAARYRDPAPAEELEACAADCRAGNEYHCFRVAESYRQGEGAKRNLLQAAEFFSAACRLELDRACQELWDLHATDPRIDPGPAVDFFEKACEPDGDGGHCFIAARAYELGRGVARDRVRALRHHQHLCELSCSGFSREITRTCLREDPSCQAVSRLTARR
jgi:hypothetical protein